MLRTAPNFFALEFHTKVRKMVFYLVKLSLVNYEPLFVGSDKILHKHHYCRIRMWVKYHSGLKACLAFDQICKKKFFWLCKKCQGLYISQPGSNKGKHGLNVENIIQSLAHIGLLSSKSYSCSQKIRLYPSCFLTLMLTNVARASAEL